MADFGTLDETEAPRQKYVDVSRETDGPDTSLLDELAEVAEKELSRIVVFPVDEAIRPGGWRLQFDAVIMEREIKKYTAAGGGNGKDPSKVDNTKATAYSLVDKNTGIFKGHQQVFDSDGDPLTLRSVEWLEKIGKQNQRNYDAIKVIIQFLGDAQVIKMGSALLAAAGYNEQMEPVDPTLG